MDPWFPRCGKNLPRSCHAKSLVRGSNRVVNSESKMQKVQTLFFFGFAFSTTNKSTVQCIESLPHLKISKLCESMEPKKLLRSFWIFIGTSRFSNDLVVNLRNTFSGKIANLFSYTENIEKM